MPTRPASFDQSDRTLDEQQVLIEVVVLRRRVRRIGSPEESDFFRRVPGHVLYPDIGRIADHRVESATAHFVRILGLPIEGIDLVVVGIIRRRRRATPEG